eukprot:CAMPEP_0118979522 /NCGR_PEP_ID=MMETSP1173-20130426/26155_1 /TAXON_ID=1034831 /ORGANISM="Rhizochromulina marina cf, Strain CCMP1243" /LENGTH=34 /DNA_ID= /DNA_START= /DNA_END= /DNA_ORIENTATION=
MPGGKETKRVVEFDPLPSLGDQWHLVVVNHVRSK